MEAWRRIKLVVGVLGVLVLSALFILQTSPGILTWLSGGRITSVPLIVPQESGPAEPIQTTPPVSTADNPYPWSEEHAPRYVREIGRAQIDDATRKLAEGEISYGELDEQGRATGVRARLTHATVEGVGEREEGMPFELKPSGWGHNEKVEILCPDGHVYSGWFWNRSHLLADSLGGETRIENLVAGTRMQNVGSNTKEDPGGMGWCESIARTWLWRHEEGDLLFSAVPVYVGNEPVCRAVIVDMESSDGEVDKRVVVFNAAKGFEIDYATGEFRAQEARQV